MKMSILSPGRLQKKDERKCQSLSASTHLMKKATEHLIAAGSDVLDPQTLQLLHDEDRDPTIPQCVQSKTLRYLATKRREFIKMRKNLIVQQNALIEAYAQLKDIETRTGCVVSEDAVGEVRLVSVSGWPAHDLLLLVRDDLDMPLSDEISGIFGPQVLQQLTAQLNPIPEDVVSVCAEIMARRLDMLNLLRCKLRIDRPSHCTNAELKSKNLDFDSETERLHRMVAGTAENLKAKVNYVLELAKIPWLDRETITKKLDRMTKENVILQNKIESVKKETEKQVMQLPVGVPNYQGLTEELAKERAAREALKEVVSSAESMLRVARARISTLERQLKDTRGELEGARKKHKDLELLVNRLANQVTKNTLEL